MSKSQITICQVQSPDSYIALVESWKESELHGVTRGLVSFASIPPTDQTQA